MPADIVALDVRFLLSMLRVRGGLFCALSVRSFYIIQNVVIRVEGFLLAFGGGLLMIRVAVVQESAVMAPRVFYFDRLFTEGRKLMGLLPVADAGSFSIIVAKG